MKIPQRLLFGLLAVLLISGSLKLIIAQLNAAPVSDSKTADSVAELIEQRDEARQTRDQLQRDLDAMTRERVDLDGELNRLKQELKDLKAQ